MRKIKILLLGAAPIITLLACLALSTDQKAEPKSFLIGNTYAFQYHAIDQSNQNQVYLAENMNKFKIHAKFTSDSTATFVINGKSTKEQIVIKKDSLFFGEINYLLTKENETPFLLSNEELIELIPIL